jgi:hypothetical protein
MIESFAAFLTPEEYFAICKKDPRTTVTLDELKQWAKSEGKCFSCESEHIWRLGRCDMCFTCTTGESDASQDYEIGEPY